MSITDELQECIRTANRSYEDARNPYNDREILHIPEEELTAIADRIDKEHAEAVADALQLRGEPDRWVKLPVDADGKVIHIGDTLKAGSKEITVLGIGRCYDGSEEFGVFSQLYEGDYEWFNAQYFQHVKSDSWESIIADAVKNGMYDHDNERIQQKLVERCRRLAGEVA